MSITASNSTVCVGGSVVLTATVTNGSAGIGYQWQSSPDGTTWSNIICATAATYAPSTATPVNLRFRVLIFK